VYKTNYTQVDLAKALDTCWIDTTRLRTQSGGIFSKPMQAILVRKSKKGNVPLATLTRHFKKRLTTTAALLAGEPAKDMSKQRADAAGVLSGLEMKMMYDWIDIMRQLYATPRRLEVRQKVLDILCARGFIGCLPSKSWVTRFVQYCNSILRVNRAFMPAERL
jgi:hypothetical protein